jgi:hypothetical protein
MPSLMPSPLSTSCPAIPPSPSLFAIVSPDQRLSLDGPGGTNYTWPDYGYLYWIAAALLLLLVFIVAVRVARGARRGRPRLLTIALLAVGALAVLLPAFYLLLVGWPGTKLDTLWWFSGSSAIERANASFACYDPLGQVDHQHTQARDALTSAASWGLLGGAVLFTFLARALPRALRLPAHGANRPDERPT